MFGRNQKEKEDKIKRLKVIGFFVFIFNTLACLFVFLNPGKWKRFIKGQKKEISELKEGKEDFSRFCSDSSKLIKNLFIPYEGNNHKPKVLRTKSLVVYVLIAVLVKLTVTGFLFFTYPSPAELSAIISANMTNLVNQSRTEAGVEPLKENLLLVEFAKQKGEDMIARDYFAHDTPEGKRPWQWINRGDYDYVYAGENLAMDFTSAEVVHEAFMKSPSHRRNILNPKYKEIGMAVLNGEMNGHPTTLLVEFFGTQRKDLSTLAQAEVINPEGQNQNPNQELPVTSVAGSETSLANQLPTAQVGQNNEGIIIVTTENKASKAIVDLVIEYSNIFFIAFLIFILVSLALNVFIKIRVQHASIILESIVVIALLLAMILVKFHFIEQVAPHLLIL